MTPDYSTYTGSRAPRTRGAALPHFDGAILASLVLSADYTLIMLPDAPPLRYRHEWKVLMCHHQLPAVDCRSTGAIALFNRDREAGRTTCIGPKRQHVLPDGWAALPALRPVRCQVLPVPQLNAINKSPAGRDGDTAPLAAPNVR